MKPFQKKDIKIEDILYVANKGQVSCLKVTKVGTKYVYFSNLRYEYGSNAIEYQWDSITWDARYWLDEDIFINADEAKEKTDRYKLIGIIRKHQSSNGYDFFSNLSTGLLQKIQEEINEIGNG
jgi:hypothetical protein